METGFEDAVLLLAVGDDLVSVGKDSLLIANIGKVAGRVLSGAAADVFTSYALNKIFGLTFGDDYFAELLGTQGLGWLSQFIQYMIKF